MFGHIIGAAVSLLAFFASSLAADADVTVKADVAYGELPHQKLDIYMPATVTADTPVLVFFFGGAWKGGAKEDLRGAGESFADAGVIFVAPDYRLWPDAVFPNFIEDSALAVSFARQELDASAGSPRPLFVGGWSSGAYNAAMVSLNQDYLASNGVPEGAVSGFIGVAGPYEGGVCAGGRCEDRFPEAERSQWAVADYIDPDDPPMLLIVAERDRYVSPSHHESLASVADSAGVDARVVEVPDASHSGVNAQLRIPESMVRDSIAAFMTDTLHR